MILMARWLNQFRISMSQNFQITNISAAEVEAASGVGERQRQLDLRSGRILLLICQFHSRSGHLILFSMEPRQRAKTPGMITLVELY